MMSRYLLDAAIKLLCHIIDLIYASGVSTVALPSRKILPIMEYGISVRGLQSPVIGEIIEQTTLCSYTEDIYGIVTPFQGKRILN